MFVREFECPSCGAQIQRTNPASRTIVCGYCNQTSHINADSLETAGEKHTLIDYGSIISIGTFGKLFDREFMILGRLRINYEDGFWDEWYIQYMDDGTTAWIQEDDGTFLLLEESKTLECAPNFDDIWVGGYTDFDGQWPITFVTSKSRAQVDGGEGELPFKIQPGEQADFIDGISEGRPISVEILSDETLLFVGSPFDIDELKLS